MDRERVTELHYITPLANLASIYEHGLVCHTTAAAMRHESVALEEVQGLRAAKAVPRGLPLHEYVNLYFDARNAMMFRIRSSNLVVIRISPTVLDWDGVVIADGNAANRPTFFLPSPKGLQDLVEERVYAERWDVGDIWEKHERKRQRQAEVLVPNRIPPDAVIGVFARTNSVAERCRTEAPNWPVEVNLHVYFDA